MTLKGHYALRFKTYASFGVHHENLDEVRPTLYSYRRCTPMTLDNGNIRFMRISAGVPWRGGVKQQWGNRERGFSGFRTLRLRHLRKWVQHYYIVLFVAFLLTPKYITLNELEWLELAFMLNFHYYAQTLRVLLAGFESIIYLRIVMSVCNAWRAKMW